MDLEVTKSGWPDPVYVLDPLTYTITVANAGLSPAADVVLTDDLPPNVALGSVVSSRGSCDRTDDAVTCMLGTLPGQAHTGPALTYVTIVVTPSVLAEGMRTNAASVASPAFDPWDDNDSAQVNTVVAPQADLAVVQSVSPGPLKVGRLITFTLVVTNHGPSLVTGIRLTDTLPEGAELSVIWGGENCSMADPVVCDLYPLGVGGAKTIAIVVMPTLTGTFTNTVRVSSDRHDRWLANNLSTETILVEADAGGSCAAVSGVQIGRTPAGDLFAGNAVRFAASAEGSVPFTHTWRLDGAPVGGDESAFEHTFAIAGAYAVNVTVDNACGQGSDVMLVDVQELAPGQSDLSGSYKSVSRANVDDGHTLTYTLVVRNNSAVTATATLTDPIPMHTTYVSGSATASDGAPVALEGGQLRWTGAVISGTPVVIQFAVEATTAGLDVGAPISNVAWLDDGQGNATRLEARSVYNPGYWMSINDGALYTNRQAVTLTLAWAPSQATEMRISNDGGLGSGSGWIPITSTHAGWPLETYGNLVLPRTVYAKFRDSSGLQYGPVQDDIIYDPNPPWVVSVDVMSVPALRFLWPQRQTNVVLRVTTADDNSGVNKVQLGHSVDLGQSSEYLVSGSKIDVLWDLQASGLVYVRAVDRAGNRSSIVEAELEEEQPTVYLPLVLKSP